MLKYMIIPLAGDAVSFCHYEKGSSTGGFMPLYLLKQAIFWSMKENLNVQFVYPDSVLPDGYKQLIDMVDHADIVGSRCEDKELLAGADVVVLDSWGDAGSMELAAEGSYVVRTTLNGFIGNAECIIKMLRAVLRLVVVLTDIDSLTDEDFGRYREALEGLLPVIADEYAADHAVQFNLLTDRIFLESMNNCGAGDESITLAPDGKFYVCPAFWRDGSDSAGDLATGVDIKNPQLFRLDHAPICRRCDAFQCRRCVWLNRKTTLEVNTPSHEQCVVAHTERNASRSLASLLRQKGIALPHGDIKEIDYLDPFEIIKS